MTEFKPFQYSKSQVEKAGEILSRPMPEDLSRMDEYSRVFKIAWEWRNSHALPMRILRDELNGQLRKAKARGITAARMKRMQSIRTKLARLTTTLVQIDDLGGCRAIVDSMDDLNRILPMYRDAVGPHRVRMDRSYIEKPKIGGYRSHHLVLEFGTKRPEAIQFQGRRIEVQLRTRLQHSWATAVEAVGLVRNEDLKGGEGNADWLRLFNLVASDFAEAERCQLVPDAPERRLRAEEVRELDNRLEAIATLHKWSQAIKQTEKFIAPGSNYFIIQFQNFKDIERSVEVKGYTKFQDDYETIEPGGTKTLKTTTVLVEVDKVENLREAYPNYFLDMSLFAQNLSRIIEGAPVAAALQSEPVSGKAVVRGINAKDLSFLENWRRRAERNR